MQVVNAVSCEPDGTFGRGAFHARVLDLTERLGASVIGATVYEMRAGEKLGPYHFHHGVEEWLYVASGTPRLRDPDGERALEAGELVAFPSGPAGAHTVHGPGRVVMFSATLYELAPDEATAAYHYEWCREEWALVASGAPTLRHADGQAMLSAGDICCFPQRPTGAHRLRNDSDEPARLIVFSTSTDRPTSTFYPDEDTVLIHIFDRERLLFRHDDRIEDYWDGEPGAT